MGHVVNAHSQSYTAANLPKTATACSCPEMSCTNARTLSQIVGGGGGYVANAHEHSYTAAHLPKSVTACACPERSCANARTMHHAARRRLGRPSLMGSTPPAPSSSSTCGSPDTSSYCCCMSSRTKRSSSFCAGRPSAMRLYDSSYRDSPMEPSGIERVSDASSRIRALRDSSAAVRVVACGNKHSFSFCTQTLAFADISLGHLSACCGSTSWCLAPTPCARDSCLTQWRLHGLRRGC